MQFNPHRQFRLPTYNYAEAGNYFVTICSKKRGPDIFGQVVEDKVVLSELGRIAESKWLELPSRFNNLSLYEYIIMPDHIHGIIALEENKLLRSEIKMEEFDYKNNEFKSGILKNPMESKNISLGQIIRTFKALVKHDADKMGFNEFYWQPKFYDRIIRDELELYFVQNYIINNPLKWKIEKEDSENEFIRELLEQRK